MDLPCTSRLKLEDMFEFLQRCASLSFVHSPDVQEFPLERGQVFEVVDVQRVPNRLTSLE